MANPNLATAKCRWCDSKLFMRPGGWAVVGPLGISYLCPSNQKHGGVHQPYPVPVPTRQYGKHRCGDCGGSIFSSPFGVCKCSGPVIAKPLLDASLHVYVREYMEDEHTDLYGLTIVDCANAQARHREKAEAHIRNLEAALRETKRFLPPRNRARIEAALTGYK